MLTGRKISLGLSVNQKPHRHYPDKHQRHLQLHELNAYWQRSVEPSDAAAKTEPPPCVGGLRSTPLAIASDRRKPSRHSDRYRATASHINPAHYVLFSMMHDGEVAVGVAVTVVCAWSAEDRPIRYIS